MNLLTHRDTKLKKRYDLGIVLSGGGVRGFAHIGVLKALEESGFYPTAISGVSSGAVVGALYADGYKPDEIYSIFKQKGFFKFLKLGLPRTGLMKLSGLIDMLNTNLQAQTFQALGKKLFVTATDFTNGREAVFQQGDLIKPIFASSSIPVLMSPVEINGNTYVDGGLMNNLPMDPLKGKCNKLIAVHVNPIGPKTEFNNLIDIAERTFHISVTGHLYDTKKQCDLFIEPSGLEEYNILNVYKAEEIYNLGYEYAHQLLLTKKESIKQG
jgi:NTE family protein